MRKVPVPSTAAPTGQSRLARGFTLIEVMIVVAIVAILAAVAIPSYRDYILRGQLVDATTLLSTMRADMERYYQDNRRYTAVGAFTPPCQIPANLTRGSFTVACVVADGPPATFLLTATGSGSTAGFVYTINQQDTRTTVTLGGNWGGAPTPNTCWVLKRGQVCT